MHKFLDFMKSHHSGKCFRLICLCTMEYNNISWKRQPHNLPFQNLGVATRTSRIDAYAWFNPHIWIRSCSESLEMHKRYAENQRKPSRNPSSPKCFSRYVCGYFTLKITSDSPLFCVYIRKYGTEHVNICNH